MRRALDFIYDASAWLAALAMIGVLAMVLTLSLIHISEPTRPY